MALGLGYGALAKATAYAKDRHAFGKPISDFQAVQWLLADAKVELDAAALLNEADVFVGPDSGPMNLAVAVGTPAFGLFGATRVLNHSRFIHPILPDDGRVSLDGMRRISPGNVLARVEPQLAIRKAGA